MQLKEGIKSLIKHYGYEVRQAQPRREDFLQSRKVDMVVDAGANVGQFGRELRKIGFAGRIMSFEPVSASFQALNAASGPDPQWTAINLGLSDAEGTADINVSAKSAFSSLHRTTRSATQFDTESAAVRSETIHLKRLDQLDEVDGKRLFIKVDTQGHERAVIEGATGLLDRTQGIQLELPISALYENTWTLSEAFGFMREKGFVPTFFAPVNYHTTDPVAIVEIDCIFRRINPSLD